MTGQSRLTKIRLMNHCHFTLKERVKPLRALKEMGRRARTHQTLKWFTRFRQKLPSVGRKTIRCTKPHHLNLKQIRFKIAQHLIGHLSLLLCHYFSSSWWFYLPAFLLEDSVRLLKWRQNSKLRFGQTSIQQNKKWTHAKHLAKRIESTLRLQLQALTQWASSAWRLID